MCVYGGAVFVSRYFILDGRTATLRYYKGKGDKPSKALGAISLNGKTTVEQAPNEREFSFKVVGGGGGTLVAQATDAAALGHWMRDIMSVISMLSSVQSFLPPQHQLTLAQVKNHVNDLQNSVICLTTMISSYDVSKGAHLKTARIMSKIQSAMDGVRSRAKSRINKDDGSGGGGKDGGGGGGGGMDAATAAKIAAGNAQVAAQLEELRQHVLELQTNASRDKHKMATQLTEIGALNLKVVQSAKVKSACCCGGKEILHYPLPFVSSSSPNINCRHEIWRQHIHPFTDMIFTIPSPPTIVF